MRNLRRIAFLIAALIAAPSYAQVVPFGTLGGGGSSTLVPGTTPTSGCTDGGFLYSLTSLLRCGAIMITDGNTVTITGQGAASAALVVNNGTSTGDIVTFQNNGVTQFEITDSNQLISPDGAVGTPPLVGSDANTGIYWTNTGQDISFSTNGTLRGSWVGTGTVGLSMSSTLYPAANNTYALGTSGLRWNILYLGGDASTEGFQLDRTITAGGTTGNQTINKPTGTVNFAAAATAITVTNAMCTTSSIVLAITRTNDATCSVKNVVPGSGSFVINMTAGCTGETSVGFVVFNGQ